MKKIARVLNVRKHKFVVFVDAYTSNQRTKQILFDRETFINARLKTGDCFAIDGVEGNSKSGQQVFNVNQVLWVSPAQNWKPAQNIPTKEKGYDRYARENALNGGDQLKVFRLKNELIRGMSTLLDQDGFESVKCQVLEPERTGSAIPVFETKTHFGNEPLYLRITPENQLKQTAAMLLKSVYTVDHVFYNKHADARHQPEFCTLEFVALEYSKQELLRFITRLSQISHDLCAKYGYQTEKSKIPEIVDYTDLERMNIKYQRRIPEFENTILTNVPVNNPFVRSNLNGVRTETRWYLNGCLTAHGYEDEVDPQKIQQALEKQKEENHCDNVNEMHYFKWGLPKSVSFGLGIDALVCRYLNLEHMTLATNPLGINYAHPNRAIQSDPLVKQMLTQKENSK